MDEEIAEAVRIHGWEAISIGDNIPPFLYTVGVGHTWAHPEMIVFGLTPPVAHSFISAIIGEIQNGRSFAEPDLYTMNVRDVTLTFATRPVHESQHSQYLGYAMGFYRHIGKRDSFRAIQVFWADDTGKFPFDSNCSARVAGVQPQLNVALTERELREFNRQFE